MKKFNLFQMNVDEMVKLNAQSLDFAPPSDATSPPWWRAMPPSLIGGMPSGGS